MRKNSGTCESSSTGCSARRLRRVTVLMGLAPTSAEKAITIFLQQHPFGAAGPNPSGFLGGLLVQVTAGIIFMAIAYLVAHVPSVWH
ncbi:hypothetical protein [Kitasatospora sp. NPDC096204]|uniref:hypothetical protein n=1 Tax=Kitasatospora sp. NPDC096204 TaxID=3364094 RepID=UPI00382E2851